MSAAACQAKASVDLGWALVKPTLCALEYMPVRIVRRGRRFTFVEPRPGVEWRYTSRGLWDGFPSEAAAYAQIDELRESIRNFVGGRNVR